MCFEAPGQDERGGSVKRTLRVYNICSTREVTSRFIGLNDAVDRGPRLRLRGTTHRNGLLIDSPVLAVYISEQTSVLRGLF